MTNYIARTGAQKKKVILAKCEDGLRQAIKKSKTEEAILRCAEKVREAQLSIIKALQYETDPASSDESEDAAFRANLEKRSIFWSDLPAEDIIQQYLPEE